MIMNIESTELEKAILLKVSGRLETQLGPERFQVLAQQTHSGKLNRRRCSGDPARPLRVRLARY
jgi:hypothetical protein